MKSVFFAFGLLGAVNVLSADPADRAILAAMRVSELKNYSWSTSVVDDARSYTIEGKTQRGALTWARLPMVPALAQRLGRDADTEVEAVFKNGNDSVIRTEQGWRRPRDLPIRVRDWNDTYVLVPVSRGARPLWGIDDPMFGDPWATSPVLVSPTPTHRDEEHRPYSNAQYGISHPHEELAVIVSSYATLTVEGDTAAGTLTDLGAQLLLVRDGQDHISPLGGAGAFKMYFKHGMVVRYLLRLEGILIVDRKRVHVRQASNTVITNAGTTQLAVPDEAQRKLQL